MSGDVTTSSAVVWCRSDRDARLVVEWSLAESFADTKRIEGPAVAAAGGSIGKVLLEGLPARTRIHYRARFDGDGPASEWIAGSFSTAPTEASDVLIAWSGDTNGQGWGIDPKRGGMPAYSALSARNPDLFIHCGDRIYADDPIKPVIELDGGGQWQSIITPEKTRVAQTLDDFRGAYAYAHLSPEVRAASAKIPLFSIWDDHEVHNNWFPGQTLDDERYREKRTSELMIPARRAMWDYTPTLRPADGPMYRVVHWGPLVDIFFVDGRSERSPNTNPPAAGGMLGTKQADWLIAELSVSRATWKIIAMNSPLGLPIAELGRDGRLELDGYANENGPPKEREVELARILSTLKTRGVKNVVFVTADVHYAAVHRFDPGKAQFKDFDPFYELIAGPMHATAFPLKAFDDTFGPELVWTNAEDKWGTPAEPRQSFGLLRIDKKTRALGITFVDGFGHDLHSLTIDAV